ncbi:MAG: UvrD-helicase domain-containing protein [Bdellovibrionaceae bacterium]|nr:UvrD-helicase domain-containing protein [Bdellovibrionales bacterium]MCB9254560.1 UvrD-helicase domain-containing protein [Pseudobdellovibrionaceae bacterium]
MWLRGLNPSQQEAAAHNEGPLLILAGAGSGKTTVLVARAGRLLAEAICSPEKLCVLTFTNKAARELKSRVAARLGGRGEQIFAGTFHSFGLQILREFHDEAGLPKFFGILDTRDTSQMLKELLRNLRQGDKTAYDADRLLAILSQWREQGRTQADRDDEYDIAAEWVLPRFLQRMQSLGAIDFDGLILRPLQLMDESPEIRARIQQKFDYVMVDEFQDTNLMQMRLIQRLVEGHRNIAVVGDDDQAIYGWRGACVKNILDFPKFYPGCKVVRLETNYRSLPPILNLANAIIRNNNTRYDKMLRPHHEAEGELPELFILRDEAEELEHVVSEIGKFEREGIARSEIAMLFRSNTQGALIEAELRKNGIPYRMRGGMGFFDRKETRDVMAYLRCAIRPHEIAFRRILNTPSRGLGDKAVEKLTAFSKLRKQSFVKSARQWQAAGLEPRAGGAIENLFLTLDGLVNSCLAPGSTATHLSTALEQIGYRKYLEKHSTDAISATKRWRFIETFAEVMEKYLAKAGKTKKGMLDFLDAMELRDNVEDEDEAKIEKVHLLTLHACKGLEFDAVILTGIEEDILPHRTLGSDISEERRLFYVGVTRAKKRLVLTRSAMRKRHGKIVQTVGSRFLTEIPKGLIVEKVGLRPVETGVRKALVADLFAKLDALDAAAKPQ